MSTSRQPAVSSPVTEEQSGPARQPGRPERKPSLADRRGSRRFPAWVDVSLAGDSTAAAPGTVVDLSLGGALVQSQVAVEPGADVTITLATKHGPAILAGHVVREEETWAGVLLHLEFSSPDAASRLALCKVLDELESEFRRQQAEMASSWR